MYDADIKAGRDIGCSCLCKEQGKYLRPYSRNLESSNELRDGYNWHEAYYLYPIGISDIRTASADRDINNSNIYQNINWPTTAGGHAEK